MSREISRSEIEEVARDVGADVSGLTDEHCFDAIFRTLMQTFVNAPPPRPSVLMAVRNAELRTAFTSDPRSKAAIVAMHAANDELLHAFLKTPRWEPK